MNSSTRKSSRISLQSTTVTTVPADSSGAADAVPNPGTLLPPTSVINPSSSEPPLSGLVCLVETTNEDGIDASSAHEATLVGLGATISRTLGETITHYIASNASPSRLLAAHLLNIWVLSPLWVEQCKEAHLKVAETDFELSLPTLSSCVQPGRTAMSLSSSLVINDRDADAAHVEKKTEPLIPLPSYKVYDTPLLPEDMEELLLNVRRSERLCDIADDKKAPSISLKDALNIPVKKKLPVVRESNGQLVASKAAQSIPPVNSTRIAATSSSSSSTRIAATSSSSSSSRIAATSSSSSSSRIAATSSSSSSSRIAKAAPLNTARPMTTSSKRGGAHVLDAAKNASVAAAVDSSSSSSSSRSGPKTKVIIALTGFSDESGEKSTMIEMLKAVMDRVKRRHSQQSRSRATTSSLVGTCEGSISPSESSVALLLDSEDYSATACTHLIVNTQSQTRTLRTIFALARELTITTEQWVYESLSREAWADPLLFPHPRYSSSRSSSSSSIIVGRRALLQDSMVCVLTYRDPASELLEELVTALGGRHTDDIMDEEIRWVLFGDGDDARTWFQRKRRQKQHLDNVDANQLKARLKAGEVFTRKFLFNCIEEGTLRRPREGEGELIGIEQVVVAPQDEHSQLSQHSQVSVDRCRADHRRVESKMVAEEHTRKSTRISMHSTRSSRGGEGGGGSPIAKEEALDEAALSPASGPPPHPRESLRSGYQGGRPSVVEERDDVNTQSNDRTSNTQVAISSLLSLSSSKAAATRTVSDPSVTVGDKRKDPTVTVGDKRKDPTVTVGDKRKDPTVTVGNNRNSHTVTVGDKRKDPTVTVGDKRKDPTVTVGDKRKDPTVTVGDKRKDPTVTVGNNRNSHTATVGDKRKDPTVTVGDKRNGHTVTVGDKRKDPNVTVGDVGDKRKDPTVTVGDKRNGPIITTAARVASGFVDPYADYSIGVLQKSAVSASEGALALANPVNHGAAPRVGVTSATPTSSSTAVAAANGVPLKGYSRLKRRYSVQPPAITGDRRQSSDGIGTSWLENSDDELF